MHISTQAKEEEKILFILFFIKRECGNVEKSEKGKIERIWQLKKDSVWWEFLKTNRLDLEFSIFYNLFVFRWIRERAW